MVRLRKILFFIFVLLYLFLCPALILYSLGIVIKPEKKRIVKTGLIYIDTIPSGASVFVDGKLHREETPTVVDNLIPGSYQLEINAPYYQAWKTIANVYPEKASPFNKIFLLPNPIIETPITQWPIKKLISVENNPFVLSLTGNNTQDIYLHLWDESFRQNIMPDKTLTTPVSKPLFLNNTSFPKGRLIKTFSAPFSPYMIFVVETINGRQLYWTDLVLGATKAEDITNLFPTLPEDIQWSDSDPRHLLTIADHAINRIDLATKAIYPKIINNAETFTLYGTTIFFLTTDHVLMKASTSIPQDKIRPVSSNPQFNELILQSFPYSRLTAASESTIFLIGKEGKLLSNIKPYLLHEKGVIGFKWNKKKQKLAFWTRTNLGLFDFSKNPSINNPPVLWINYPFKQINQAYWINDADHLIIENDNKLLIANTECCNLTDIRPIINIPENSNTFYSEKTGRIFLIQKETFRLAYIDIIPKHSLLNPATKDRKEKDPVH